MVNKVGKQIKPIIIVQGAQWGSEGKGMVTAALCSSRDVDYAVRTGSVNAGHTVVRRDGREFKMQQIPCGFLNPQTQLVIGAGAFIEPSILLAEIKMLQTLVDPFITKRLFVDSRCGVHLPSHQATAKAANRHHKMGATGKGCSEALVSKIRERGEDNVLLFWEWLFTWGEHGHLSEEDYETLTHLHYCDTAALLNEAYDSGEQILLEGTQGTLLDLHLGPYPYTTNKQTTASQWVTEAGLSPSLEYEVALVTRMYPIRVAGNSGPMPREISWFTLARRINQKLYSRGYLARCGDWALDAFEKECAQVASEMSYKMPKMDGDGVNWAFETWTPAQRKAYKVALSDLHAVAISRLAPDVIKELTRILELTTVTRKLRRVAELDLGILRESIMLNSPAYLVLTFLNHECPWLWYEDRDKVVFKDQAARDVIQMVESSTGVPVRYVSTGAESRHLLEFNKMARDLEPSPGPAIRSGS